MPAGQSSSYADRIARQFEQHYGRPASADDPEYAAYIRTALPQMVQQDQTAYEASKNRWNTFGHLVTGAALAPYAAVALPAMLGGGAAATGTAAATGAATGGGMTGQTGLGIAQLLTGLFTNLWGANKAAGANERATNAQIAAQNRAAELQYQGLTDALNYQKSVDARDYQDWLAREARDRADWEASEQRRAPFRALADSAVRTLADYIRVPGMQPAQEIPVQHWTAPTAQAGNPGVSTTMPVGGTLAAFAQPTPDQPLLARYSRTPRTMRDLTY